MVTQRILRLSLLFLLFLVCAGCITVPESLADRPWEDEIVYGINLPRFYDGNTTNDIMLKRYGPFDETHGGYGGGDLDGVIQKLDYLSGLGVTTLFISPVVQNDQYPVAGWYPGGYRPKDYFRVDENLGTTQTLVSLVNKAHDKGMRVMIDMPLALPGFENPLLTQANVDKGYFGAATDYGVPAWNGDNAFVSDYLIGIAKYWHNLTNCDAFRLDSAQLMSDAFWTRFAREVDGSPYVDDFFLMAEVAKGPGDIGQFLTDTKFDSAYDFSFTIAQPVFGKSVDVSQVAFVAMEAKKYYPSPARMVSEIDNYDDAFVRNTNEPKVPRTKLALAFLMTMDRIPLIYQGDEAGMWSWETGKTFDPALRNTEVFDYTKQLIALRKSEAALRRGSFQEVQNKNPIYAYLRNYRTSDILVVTNNSTQTVSVSFPIRGAAWSSCGLYDLMEKKTVKNVGATAPLSVPPFGAMILRVDPNRTAVREWERYGW